MTPFATRFSRLTERQRYKTAIVGTWVCGALTGLGVGMSLLAAFSNPTLTVWMTVGLMTWVTVVSGVMFVGSSRRLLMRYAPEGDAQPATQTFTGGCSGECYGWRRYDDPSVGGCEKATCERLRQQPQPEPNQDTR